MNTKKEEDEDQRTSTESQSDDEQQQHYHVQDKKKSRLALASPRLRTPPGKAMSMSNTRKSTEDVDVDVDVDNKKVKVNAFSMMMMSASSFSRKSKNAHPRTPSTPISTSSRKRPRPYLTSAASATTATTTTATTTTCCPICSATCFSLGIVLDLHVEQCLAKQEQEAQQQQQQAQQQQNTNKCEQDQQEQYEPTIHIVTEQNEPKEVLPTKETVTAQRCRSSVSPIITIEATDDDEHQCSQANENADAGADAELDNDDTSKDKQHKHNKAEDEDEVTTETETETSSRSRQTAQNSESMIVSILPIVMMSSDGSDCDVNNNNIVVSSIIQPQSQPQQLETSSINTSNSKTPTEPPCASLSVVCGDYDQGTTIKRDNETALKRSGSGTTATTTGTSSATGNNTKNAFSFLMEQSKKQQAQEQLDHERKMNMSKARFHLHANYQVTWLDCDCEDGTSAPIASPDNDDTNDCSLRGSTEIWSTSTKLSNISSGSTGSSTGNSTGNISPAILPIPTTPIQFTNATQLIVSSSIPTFTTPARHINNNNRCNNNKLSVPVLKSMLQKSIRRRRPRPAMRLACALYKKSPLDLLRRLPIIVLEDGMFHPDFALLVWLMVACSTPGSTNMNMNTAIDNNDNQHTNIDHNININHHKEAFVPPPPLMDRVYRIVYELAACPWRDEVKLILPESLSLSLSSLCPGGGDGDEAHQGQEKNIAGFLSSNIITRNSNSSRCRSTLMTTKTNTSHMLQEHEREHDDDAGQQLERDDKVNMADNHKESGSGGADGGSRARTTMDEDHEQEQHHHQQHQQWQQCVCWINAMLLRAKYGGMACDVKMLHAYAKLWMTRFFSIGIIDIDSTDTSINTTRKETKASSVSGADADALSPVFLEDMAIAIADHHHHPQIGLLKNPEIAIATPNCSTNIKKKDVDVVVSPSPSNISNITGTININMDINPASTSASTIRGASTGSTNTSTTTDVAICWYQVAMSLHEKPAAQYEAMMMQQQQQQGQQQNFLMLSSKDACLEGLDFHCSQVLSHVVLNTHHKSRDGNGITVLQTLVVLIDPDSTANAATDRSTSNDQTSRRVITIDAMASVRHKKKMEEQVMALCQQAMWHFASGVNLKRSIYNDSNSSSITGSKTQKEEDKQKQNNHKKLQLLQQVWNILKEPVKEYARNYVAQRFY
jgi:hypothetical protein